MKYYLIFGLIQLALSAPPVVVRLDHLDGVPLERDGGLNKNYREEAILGKDVLRSDSPLTTNPSEVENDIRAMFKAADTDKNDVLTADELKNQIAQNLEKHMDDGKKEAEAVFNEIDMDGDGIVTWHEYQRQLLVQKLIAKSLTDADAMTPQMFGADMRRVVDEEKASFQKADADGKGLNPYEWVAFQHPEHSQTMLLEMAKDILSSFDDNRDGVLTIDEFANPPPGEPVDPEMDQLEIETRKTEFKTEIDTNADGKATLGELFDYVNPKNIRHAVQEVADIMDMVDSNRDGFLSLKELLNNKDALIHSAFIKPKKMLHDDL